MTFHGQRGRRDGSHWTKVGDQPERWESPGFGVIVARASRLWAFVPVCGHDYYAAFSLEDAQTQAASQAGLCRVCWQLGVTGATRSSRIDGPITARKVELEDVRARDRQPDLVLVVEDDIDTRECVGELLEDYGYSVLGAGNGAEAVQLLHSGAVPSVILLDLMMPVMDGYRFRAAQRADPTLAAIPVIVITAGTSIVQDEINASAVMRKPLHVPRLLATVSQHCSC